MPRVFAYCRVSTADQTTDNQLLEIANSGFTVEPHRAICENVSGSTAATSRPGFTKLTERMERNDVLIVTKLDRLGRNAMDVRATVDKLAAAGVRVHCLALGGADLTSSAGRMTMQIIAAVAEFERDLLIERTNAGLMRAVAAGTVLGRPSKTTDKQRDAIRAALAGGATVSATARQYQVSRATIIGIRDK